MIDILIYLLYVYVRYYFGYCAFDAAYMTFHPFIHPSNNRCRLLQGLPDHSDEGLANTVDTDVFTVVGGIDFPPIPALCLSSFTSVGHRSSFTIKNNAVAPEFLGSDGDGSEFVWVGVVF